MLSLIELEDALALDDELDIGEPVSVMSSGRGICCTVPKYASDSIGCPTQQTLVTGVP
jgi:hypothetical protein